MQSNIISIRNLVKSFNKFKVLKGISFDVRYNSITGFLGPNGAGKTTTIRLILGFLNPDEGLIEIFGENKRHNIIMMKIGYVSEAPQFYPYLTGRQVMELTGRLLKIELNNLNKDIEYLSKFFSLSNYIEKKILSYSFGTIKKLAFAQSMLGDPELFIFDEPYNGLDPIAINRVREMILELKGKGKTIFISSHLLSEMEKVCDDVVLINNGTIILCGNIIKLKEEWRIISAIKTHAELKKILWEKRGVEIEEGIPWISVINNSNLIELMNEEPFKSAISVKETPSLEDIFLNVVGND
ncbi:MAG: ABC transporter ATP-binding protein [Candidatus Omnitrophica bacterium]|nr:ABC transporter ATP-binding protein [Candidatus Omnitrophota bacterium]